MISFKNYDQLLIQLERSTDYLTRARKSLEPEHLEDVMLEATELYKNSIIKNAPERTGTMTDHIKKRRAGTVKQIECEVYGEKQSFYWRFQEYGAYNVWKKEFIPGKHFVAKSINETDPRVKRYVESEISRYINK